MFVHFLELFILFSSVDFAILCRTVPNCVDLCRPVRVPTCASFSLVGVLVHFRVGHVLNPVKAFTRACWGKTVTQHDIVNHGLGFFKLQHLPLETWGSPTTPAAGPSFSWLLCFVAGKGGAFCLGK